MKHIIIAGAPRSGKTTISRELISFTGCVHYRLDSIKRAVFDILSLNKKDWWFASRMTAQIIDKLVDDNEQESVRKEFFIFDTPHLYPREVAENLDLEKFVVVFLGYTDVNIEEKVGSILKYDAKTCWTHKLSIQELTSLVKGNVRFSKEIKEQCEKYGIPYFDVSKDPLYVLNEVKRYIKANL